FMGMPSFASGEAVLFDSGANAGTLPDACTLTRLMLRFTGGDIRPEDVDPGLTLLLYVDDLSSPRARVRLADLLKQGGERPLNIAKLPGQVVRLVLVDPAGSWASAAPEIEVAMGW